MSENKKLNTIGRYIISNIISDNWKEHEKIPSEGFFEYKFSVSNAIVKKTISKLIKINLLYSKERVGTYVQTNKLRTLFKRESKTDGCNSFVSIKGNVTKYFKFKEILEKFSNDKTAIDTLNNVDSPKNTFSFTKMYLNTDELNKIRKVSFSFINKDLVDEKIFDKKLPLHENLIDDINLPYSRITFSFVENYYLDNVKNTLKLKKDEDVIVKYVVLLNKDKKVIHAAKIYIKKECFFNITKRSI